MSITSYLILPNTYLYLILTYSILRKLTVMISRQASLMAQCDALQRQATSATEAAQRLLDAAPSSAQPTDNVCIAIHLLLFNTYF